MQLNQQRITNQVLLWQKHDILLFVMRVTLFNVHDSSIA